MRAVYLIVLVLAVVSAVRAQDSLGMRRVSVLDYWTDMNEIQMVGDTAYVMGVSTGLHILDLADAANPRELGRWYKWGEDCGGTVTVSGSLAYVEHCGGSFVLDISDPAHITELAYWAEEYGAGFFLVHGNVGVAVDNEGYPYVIDLSDLENVRRVGEFTGFVVQTTPFGMAGDYFCLVGIGITVWNLSDPTQPLLVASVDTLDGGYNAAMAGNYAYFPTSTGLHIIDMSNPLQPMEVAVCDSGECEHVAVGGHNAIVCKSWGMDIWNVEDPIHPVYESSLPMNWSGIGPYISMSASPTRICAGVGSADSIGVILDISNPQSPVIARHFGKVGLLLGMSVEGNRAALSDCEVGFHLIDLTDPASPMDIGHPGGPLDFHYSTGVSLRGNYVYDGIHNRGLVTYGISTPAQPESLACWHCGDNWEWGSYVWHGDYGYLNTTHGFYTMSFTDPVHPVPVDTMETAGGPCVVFGGYLYIAESLSQHLVVYDLADPANPQPVGSCALPVSIGAYPTDVAVSGNYAYVALRAGGLHIVDVSDPTHPVGVNTFEGDLVTTVAARDGALFVADGGHIHAYDLTDPVHPSLTGYYDTADDQFTQIEILGQYLLTVHYGQFCVYACDALQGSESRSKVPYEFALYPAYPNPFNPSTVLRFALPKTERARLTVYDVTGRQVNVVSDGVVSAGEHQARFNGSALASGVYFARLEAGKNVKTEKLMLVK